MNSVALSFIEEENRVPV